MVPDCSSYEEGYVLDVIANDTMRQKYLRRNTFEKGLRISVGPGVVIYSLKNKKYVSKRAISNAISNLEQERQIIKSGMDILWKNPERRLVTIKKELRYLRSKTTQ